MPGLVNVLRIRSGNVNFAARQAWQSDRRDAFEGGDAATAISTGQTFSQF